MENHQNEVVLTYICKTISKRLFTEMSMTSIKKKYELYEQCVIIKYYSRYTTLWFQLFLIE